MLASCEIYDNLVQQPSSSKHSSLNFE